MKSIIYVILLIIDLLHLKEKYRKKRIVHETRFNHLFRRRIGRKNMIVLAETGK